MHQQGRDETGPIVKASCQGETWNAKASQKGRAVVPLPSLDDEVLNQLLWGLEWPCGPFLQIHCTTHKMDLCAPRFAGGA